MEPTTCLANKKHLTDSEWNRIGIASMEGMIPPGKFHKWISQMMGF